MDGLVNLVIRTTGSPAALARDVRSLVPQIERDAMVDRIEPLTRSVTASLEAPRFAATAVAGFASSGFVRRSVPGGSTSFVSCCAKVCQ